MLVGLFTTVMMLGGEVPTIDLVPGQFYEYGECLHQVELSKGIQHDAFDDKGRPILDVQYSCQIMEIDPTIADLEALKKG